MTSKTKTFEAESEFGDVMDWFMKNIETEYHEIIQNTPPSYDVEVRTTKKYRITIQEVEVKKGEV